MPTRIPAGRPTRRSAQAFRPTSGIDVGIVAVSAQVDDQDLRAVPEPHRGLPASLDRGPLGAGDEVRGGGVGDAVAGVGATSNVPITGGAMGNYAGIDWASEKHDVLIEDPAGEALLAATFRHDEDGVSALSAALVCFDVEVVAIERPDGLLVDRLLEAGVRVLALHPNQVKAARDRFRASGGKSDQFDRFVLCELARTDSHRFRMLEPDLDETKALRALV